MQFLARVRLFDGITGEADIKRARKAFAKQLKFIMGSGAVVASGAFASQRGGCFILEADSGEQLRELFGAPILDNFDVQVEPLYPMETLQEFLGK